MPVYKITYRDGSVREVTEKTLSEAASRCYQPTTVIKIEEIDARERILDIKIVNDAFHKFGKSYHSIGEIYNFVTDTLIANGFLEPDLSGLKDAFGAIRCLPVGRDTFLCVTWYQMPSSKYEFVGYVS